MPRVTGTGPRPKAAGGGGQRGIALLMVLGLLALLGTVVADFQYSSHVAYRLAVGARDDLQAEYNALSALRLRAVMLRQAQQIQAAVGSLMQLVLGGGGGAGAPPIGRILEMIPVECGMMSAIIRKTGGGGDDEGDFFPGECLATSESEHAKIALNTLANPTTGTNNLTTLLLLGLLSDRRLEKHFQKDDRSGSHAETPAELVGAITDWIDPDKNQVGSGAGDEDRYYANLRDPYRSKNAPFDSVDELQLVHGINDELFALLRPHVTIYSGTGQIELGTAPFSRIVLGLLGCLRDGVAADQLFAHPGLAEVYRAYVELQQMSGGLGAMNVTMLRTLLMQFRLDAVVDTSDRLQRVFQDSSSTTWFSVEAQGRVGHAMRRVHAVFQTIEGQFYYFRIE